MKFHNILFVHIIVIFGETNLNATIFRFRLDGRLFYV